MLHKNSRKPQRIVAWLWRWRRLWGFAAAPLLLVCLSLVPLNYVSSLCVSPSPPCVSPFYVSSLHLPAMSPPCVSTFYVSSLRLPTMSPPYVSVSQRLIFNAFDSGHDGTSPCLQKTQLEISDIFGIVATWFSSVCIFTSFPSFWLCKRRDEKTSVLLLQ